MKHKIKQIAEQIAREKGLVNLSCIDLCARAGISAGSFKHVVGQTFQEFVNSLRGEGLPVGDAVGKSRLNPNLRADHIILSGLSLAEQIGFSNLTRDKVAEAAGVTGGLVGTYFPFSDLKHKVMLEAVERRSVKVLAEGMALDHPAALDIPNDLKSEVIAYLCNK